MDKLKGLFGYVVLGACVFIAYQGYQNSANPEATEALAESVACDIDSRCLLKDDRPRQVESDVVGRSYRWRTSVGMVRVTCQRAQIFLGPWDCEPEFDTPTP